MNFLLGEGVGIGRTMLISLGLRNRCDLCGLTIRLCADVELLHECILILIVGIVDVVDGDDEHVVADDGGGGDAPPWGILPAALRVLDLKSFAADVTKGSIITLIFCCVISMDSSGDSDRSDWSYSHSPCPVSMIFSYTYEHHGGTIPNLGLLGLARILAHHFSSTLSLL
mmetsp:Transcript_5595/g.9955  ORF Transcript_5595/g.9955 Transcript_5595/m.9955 type:complete len:170 (-) Transcript_5595:136-645(-)